MSSTEIKRTRSPLKAVVKEPKPFAPVPGEKVEDMETRIIAKYSDKAKTPLKAIRAFCVICTGGVVRAVGRCTATSCTLYPYRMGTNPYGKHKPKD